MFVRLLPFHFSSVFSYPLWLNTLVLVNQRTTKCTSVFLYREKFLQEVNSLIQKPSHPLAKTKTLVKSLMNRAELLLHVTIAAQSGLTRSISGTPAETPGTADSKPRKALCASLFIKHILVILKKKKKENNSCVLVERKKRKFQCYFAFYFF